MMPPKAHYKNNDMRPFTPSLYDCPEKDTLLPHL